MRILVLGGAGKMGSAVAWDLAKDAEVEVVGIADRQKESLQRAKEWISSGKVIPHLVDLTNRKDTLKLIQGYQVAVLALPDRPTDYIAVEGVIEAGLNSVDMMADYHRRPDPYDAAGLGIPWGLTLEEYGERLHRKALNKSMTLVDGMGFAPGLSNTTLGEGLRKLDQGETAVARVGGIPSKQAAQNHPLRYMITWAFENVLNMCTGQVLLRKAGRVTEVEATSELEAFRFTQLGKNEELECAITAGMPSFIHTRPHLVDFAEKTIRWPGHWGAIQTLKECGLFDPTPMVSKGGKIVPREVLSSVLSPKLQPLQGETDVCIMWNTVTGRKNNRRMRVDYYMWEEADPTVGLSAMARVTALPVAVTARLLGKGEIKEKGMVPPEDCIKGDIYQTFMKELEKRKITIVEVSQTE